MGDEFFVADRKLDTKARMRASVKEVQKLSADARKAVGVAGGPSYGAPGKITRRGATELDRPWVAIAPSPMASLSQLAMSLEHNSGKCRRKFVLSVKRKNISHGTARTSRVVVSPPPGGGTIRHNTSDC